MPRHAFILGGTGQIGRAIAVELIEQGWRVTVAHRGTHTLPSNLSERGVEVVFLDREKPGELAWAVRSGADALIDTVAFGLDHARQLIEVQDSVGTFVVISSSSVYRDALGKTLDEARQSGFPDLPVPIPEVVGAGADALRSPPAVDFGSIAESALANRIERTSHG